MTEIDCPARCREKGKSWKPFRNADRSDRSRAEAPKMPLFMLWLS